MAGLQYEMIFNCPVDIMPRLRDILTRSGVYNLRQYEGNHGDLGHQLLSGICDAPSGYDAPEMLGMAERLLSSARKETGQRRIGVLVGKFPIEKGRYPHIDMASYAHPRSCY